MSTSKKIVYRRSDGYRCDACRKVANRCAACRKARRARQRARYAAKRRYGQCLYCDADAVENMRLCKKHQHMNNRISAAAHRRTRSAA